MRNKIYIPFILIFFTQISYSKGPLSEEPFTRKKGPEIGIRRWNGLSHALERKESGFSATLNKYFKRLKTDPILLARYQESKKETHNAHPPEGTPDFNSERSTPTFESAFVALAATFGEEFINEASRSMRLDIERRSAVVIKELEEEKKLSYDVIVVGTGPTAIAYVAELKRSGFNGSILMIEESNMPMSIFARGGMNFNVNNTNGSRIVSPKLAKFSSSTDTSDEDTLAFSGLYSFGPSQFTGNRFAKAQDFALSGLATLFLSGKIDILFQAKAERNESQNIYLNVSNTDSQRSRRFKIESGNVVFFSGLGTQTQANYSGKEYISPRVLDLVKSDRSKLVDIATSFDRTSANSLNYPEEYLQGVARILGSQRYLDHAEAIQKDIQGKTLALVGSGDSAFVALERIFGFTSNIGGPKTLPPSKVYWVGTPWSNCQELLADSKFRSSRYFQAVSSFLKKSESRIEFVNKPKVRTSNIKMEKNGIGDFKVVIDLSDSTSLRTDFAIIATGFKPSFLDERIFKPVVYNIRNGEKVVMGFQSRYSKYIEAGANVANRISTYSQENDYPAESAGAASIEENRAGFANTGPIARALAIETIRNLSASKSTVSPDRQDMMQASDAKGIATIEFKRAAILTKEGATLNVERAKEIVNFEILRILKRIHKFDSGERPEKIEVSISTSAFPGLKFDDFRSPIFDYSITFKSILDNQEFPSMLVSELEGIVKLSPTLRDAFVFALGITPSELNTTVNKSIVFELPRDQQKNDDVERKKSEEENLPIQANDYMKPSEIIEKLEALRAPYAIYPSEKELARSFKANVSALYTLTEEWKKITLVLQALTFSNVTKTFLNNKVEKLLSYEVVNAIIYAPRTRAGIPDIAIAIKGNEVTITPFPIHATQIAN